ncbi:MAG: 4-(cytidine 5'-diphospho)-2-C-methyl-D-erythritol kinase [Sphingobacteriales bacterium]|nr:MAG: 4-(cytidine 5'-diphospho)-2-C-methyl-D-erythritol kinase [Sphingobacteriales bacterium]
MLSFPISKINLGLYVTEKRTDGYHNLETVFYPIPLRDVLEVIPSTESRIEVSGKVVAGNTTDNLVWKAFQLVQQEYPEKVLSSAIYLHKAIPMGAGLGGGSSDGACMLRILNDVYHLDLGDERLAELALMLGSDCPFFIYGKPMFASGRGEELTPIALDLSAYSIQVICPDLHVSTATAFSLLHPTPAATDLRQLASLPMASWKDKVSNVFEEAAFRAHPPLQEIKEQLYTQGALYASMSGSGSAIYGIFEKETKAEISTTLEFESHYL